MSEFEKKVTMMRTMTHEEAEKKARAMGLEEAVVEYVSEKFYHFHDSAEDSSGRAIFAGEWVTEDEAPKIGVGSGGRIAYGMSWDSAWDQLREFMERGEEDVTEADVDRVWDAFFEE